MTRTPQSHRRTDPLIAAALFVLTLGLYWQVRHFDFINFDDNGYVAEAAYVQAGLTVESIVWAFTTPAMSNWHPLTWLSYMLDVQLFGAAPGPIHLVNAILHSINTALLFGVLLQMTNHRWPSAWVAAMFAWHPLHVESVAWISERKDVLSTLFMLLSMIAYAKYVRKPNLRIYSMMLLSFALGLMSKPMVVTLPCVLLLLDFWPLKRLSDPATAPPRILAHKPLNALIVEKLPMFFLAGLGSAITYWVQNATHAVATASSIPILLRIANAIVSYVKYLQDMIAPSGLAIFYPHPGTYPAGHISSDSIAISSIILILLTIFAMRTRRTMPWILVGWLWYLGTLVPVIGLVQVGSQARADRYTYVPLIGIFIAVGWSALWLMHMATIKRAVIGIIGGTVCVTMIFLAYRQIALWRDSETLLRHAIEVVPDNYMAHCNLGEVYDFRHETESARAEYFTVLRIKPEDAIALSNLAIHAADRGDFDEAIELFERSIRRDSTHVATYNNYGNALRNLGRTTDAVRAFQKAMQIDPDSPSVYHNYALTLAQGGRVDEATPLWQKAVKLKPDYTEAHFGLAQALLLARKDREAIASFRAALRSSPDRADILANLAWVLATNAIAEYRDGAQAVQLAQRACDLTHQKDAISLDSLAAGQALVGEFKRAVENAHLAADLAKRDNNTNLAQQIERRIALYEKGEPYISGR